MDGTYILFQPPASAGSCYFNYKGGHTIVLLVVADAKYRFNYEDVGVNGRVSDGGVFRETSVAAAIARNLLQFPADKSLPGRDIHVPFVFVADDAFPFTDGIMKPFPFADLTLERLYNYHLSRARRVVENAFGILSNRFRIFLTTINLAPEKEEAVTLAAVSLHNFRGTNMPAPNVEDFNALPGLPEQEGNRPGNLAYNIRNEF
ncbi:uncharacterized protein LOC124162982 [Ischnura elegans]|uniref:uncharacterized protein LOC124162982 n=1 Tax=Ischnura elegans TaxID=197161 RepID=UPI001ED8A646|nr:uncharacterized protein LOC124162982 [Ischnura elegans]